MRKAICILILVCLTYFCSFSQNGWTQLADYPGSGSPCMVGVGYKEFGMAGFGYYGSSSNSFKDWWQYLPSNNTWTQKADLTGAQRYVPTAFSTGNYSYVCAGKNVSGFFNDLWQYNLSNVWTQKAIFPGGARYGAIAEVSGSKAYMGLGEQDNTGCIGDYFADLYEYDEATNNWTAKAAFPGQARYFPLSFLINNVIYVLGGRSENACIWVYLKDMWAYDIAGNTWSQKTSYPGSGSMGIGGFALGQFGYAGMGFDASTAYSDFWRYNPQTDTWTQLPDFPGGTRYALVRFSIGNTGFIGCGLNTYSSNMQDFWSFIDPFNGLPGQNIEDDIKLYPVPADQTLTVEGPKMKFIEIYTSNGTLVIHSDVNILQNKVQMDISSLASGFYYAKISFGKNIITKKVIKAGF